jgi:GMP synthase (glutamine-hydrolysing)
LQVAPTPQIAVLDAGGQYCHLIARKVREFGVYAEVHASETPAGALRGAKGLIISGGPSSVYEAGSPTVDPGIFSTGQPVLGICYGLQLAAHLLGGAVSKGVKGEFGIATLELEESSNPLFGGLPPAQQVWMSHRDLVSGLPPGFHRFGSTVTCPVAAAGDPERGIYGVQFHPEVVHTTHGKELLSNFLFRVCGCGKDWDPGRRIPTVEESIRETVGDRSVFFFASGGVDSTVAYTLCRRALGGGRVRGVYVDTGLMREGESAFVARTMPSVAVENAQSEFLAALEGVCDPEAKRHIIGEQFLKVQERVAERYGLLDGHWILGQGTIYPDTIESGGTAKAALIKTHHNRVEGIQRLIERNLIVEPLRSFYKDEVREIGRELGLPAELLDRHPFPGPGLAIRCLCSSVSGPWPSTPIHSVGVQGDSRSYSPVQIIEEFPGEGAARHAAATELINRTAGTNRVVALVASRSPLAGMRVAASTLTAARLERLRRADQAVRAMCDRTGFEKRVWQFPVILVPLGTPDAPDSVVLRPVDSVDGMTAQSVLMEEQPLRLLADELLGIEGVAAVLYDLTHKPPGTIEWE